jgi:hypothetical protein
MVRASKDRGEDLDVLHLMEVDRQLHTPAALPPEAEIVALPVWKEKSHCY